MNDDPLLSIALASMPPYICRKCGREMGGKWATVNGRWTEAEPGCQPGACLDTAHTTSTPSPRADD